MISSIKNLDTDFTLELELGNVCNFKCRICVPELSSTWVAENKKHHLFFDFR